MPVRELPPHPSLDQLKLQAKELQRAHRERNLFAAARISARHPRRKGQSLQEVLDGPLTLAEAQMVLAREYGFSSWADLKISVETESRVAQFTPHPRTDEAVAAMDGGNIDRLRNLIAANPELVHARTNLQPPYGYFTGATLLHYVARNPGRDLPVPNNIVDSARLLLEAGSDVDALTLGRSRATTMGLVLTSKQASDANISGPLIDLLLKFDATLDLKSIAPIIPDWGHQYPLDIALENLAPRAADKLIELGAKVDVCVAAARGRINLLLNCFDEEGRLRSRPRRGGKVLSERDAIGLALLFAYSNRHSAAVDFLIEKDGNWDMIGVMEGAALHWAAQNNDLAMVKRLVARGADLSNRQNQYVSTPLAWADHFEHYDIVDWIRRNCAVDLHDAVCFDMMEQIEARLLEDPASVNARRDQWDIPQCTPLHWAAWPTHQNENGTVEHDVAMRERTVKLLLKEGADPNIVAGNGCTALDIAEAGGADRVAQLLRQHGGKRAVEL